MTTGYADSDAIHVARNYAKFGVGHEWVQHGVEMTAYVAVVTIPPPPIPLNWRKSELAR